MFSLHIGLIVNSCKDLKGEKRFLQKTQWAKIELRISMCTAENILFSLLSLQRKNFSVWMPLYSKFLPEDPCETTQGNSLMPWDILINSIIRFYSYYSYHFIDTIRQSSRSQNKAALNHYTVRRNNVDHL